MNDQRKQARPLVIGIGFLVLISAIALLRQANQRASDNQQDAAPSPERPTTRSLASFEPHRPIEIPDRGYTSSRGCSECHSQQHASWHASYHRTMTQVAYPAAVIGDFDDVEVSIDGRDYRMYREGNVCWAEVEDLNATRPNAPTLKQPIVMTTGSHHMQVYWYPTGNSRSLGQMPLIYLKEAQRWIPRRAAFLNPPGHPSASETGRWNSSCCLCHSTGPRPLPDGSGGWDTVVTEFGIACEACHGPADDHVRLHRSSQGRAPDRANDPIVNPSHLTHRRSSQVCGQCHSINERRDSQTALARGDEYRPGDDLEQSRMIAREDQPTRDYFNRMFEDVDSFMRGLYWPDGMVRVSGREYNGLIESACFREGQLSCLSCHAMHKSDEDPRSLPDWANDQLAAQMETDKACLQCHDHSQYDSTHTHHAAGSSGGACYNCHMPHTTYGLMKAIRSHKISSPNVESDLRAGRPNACNLCHLDKTLAWTSSYLQQWYELEPADLTDDEQSIAASLLWLLRGDAGERALAAWSMNWPPALEASGSEWQAPFLACLLDDPYDAVRFIADRSLRTKPGFADIDYDFIGPEAERRPARDRVWQTWANRPPTARHTAPELLIDADSGLQFESLNRLLEQRNDRPVDLLE